jgi:hypothetical protein
MDICSEFYRILQEEDPDAPAFYQRIPSMKRKFSLVVLLFLFLLFPLAVRSFGSDAESTGSVESPAQWPDKIGPFEIHSTDRRHTLRFGLAMQILLQAYSKDNGESAERENSFYEELRRMRPTLNGSFIDGAFDFYLQLNTAPNAVELLDYYIGYNPRPYFRIRVGQWKIPFTHYRTESFKNLALPDWAITTRNFGAERQFGIALQGETSDRRKIHYAFGIFTGVNARSSHALGMANLYGEEIVNRSDLAEISPRTEFNPEIVARFGYNHNNIDISRDSDFERGPAGFHLGISATYDPEARKGSDFTARLSPEFMLKSRGFSMLLAYYLGWGKRFIGSPSTELAMKGAHMQLSYLFTGRLELAARYAVVGFGEKFRRDARLRADALIAAAEDPSEAESLALKYKNAGVIVREHEASMGVNAYIVGSYLKWQNDISFLIHDRIDSNREDFRYRSQLLLAF